MLKKFLSFLIITLFLASCSNQFAYKPNNWTKVTETEGDNPQIIYLDSNRLECKDGKCRTWIKMLFGKDKPVNFSGDKQGQVSGTMLVRRVDAAVDYDCKNRVSRINAYQLYDARGKMIDKKWISGEREYARTGTVHGDVLNYVCK